MIFNLLYFLFSGPKADPAILGHNAQEDPELCHLGARQANHSERRSSGSRLPQHCTGKYEIWSNIYPVAAILTIVLLHCSGS